MAAVCSVKLLHAVIPLAAKRRNFSSSYFSSIVRSRSLLASFRPCIIASLQFNLLKHNGGGCCRSMWTTPTPTTTMTMTKTKTKTSSIPVMLNRRKNCSRVNTAKCNVLWASRSSIVAHQRVAQLSSMASERKAEMETKIMEQKAEVETKTEAKSPPPPPPPGGDFSTKAMKYTLIGFGLMFSGISGFLVMSWGSEPLDEEGNPMKDEYSDLPTWKAYLLRTWREINYYDKLIKEPSRDKLLPDPLTEPYYQPPYTLVLEMTGILVHPDWTYKTGWRFKKRPAVDYFLQQVGPPLFEVVIYTSEQGFTAFPILDTLDPNGYIMYRLFRDATRYLKGHHIKDLSCLNRDLRKVIFIDWNEKSFQMQPENALKLKKWQGSDDDRNLIDLAAFLRTVATSQVDDVRPVLAFYKQFEDPLLAFKENQRKLQEEQERVVTQAELTDRSLNWTKSFFKRWQ